MTTLSTPRHRLGRSVLAQLKLDLARQMDKVQNPQVSEEEQERALYWARMKAHSIRAMRMELER